MCSVGASGEHRFLLAFACGGVSAFFGAERRSPQERRHADCFLKMNRKQNDPKKPSGRLLADCSQDVGRRQGFGIELYVLAPILFLLLNSDGTSKVAWSRSLMCWHGGAAGVQVPRSPCTPRQVVSLLSIR